MGADGATVAYASDTFATAPRDGTLIRAGAAQRLARSSATGSADRVVWRNSQRGAQSACNLPWSVAEAGGGEPEWHCSFSLH